MIFIINVFRTVVFIFIVISTTFRLICPPAFFVCLSNSETYTEHRNTASIESTGVACSDLVSHNRVQALRIPVLLLAFSQDWTCNLQMIVSLEANKIRTGDPRERNKGHSSKFCVGFRVRQTPEKAGRHIGRNVVEITMKMKAIVRKLLMIKMVDLP